MANGTESAKETVLNAAAAIIEKRRQVAQLNQEISELEDGLEKLLSRKPASAVEGAARPVRAKKDAAYARFLKVVGGIRGTFGPRDVPEDAGFAKSYVPALVAQALAEKKIRRIGRGRYRSA